MLRLFTLLILCSFSAFSATLSLSNYLSEVKGKNPEVKAALMMVEAQRQKEAEKDIFLSPNLFFDGQYQSDQKLSTNPILVYDKFLFQNYSLGFSKLFSYGQAVRLYYNVTHYEYVNSRMGAAGSMPTFYDARPVLELTQSLWGNGFGRATRARFQGIENRSKAAFYQAQFQLRNLEVGAEGAYWRLVLAREKVQARGVALQNSKRLLDWANTRVSRQLGDAGDALQARAAFEVRELELQAAKDEELESSRAFNQLRHIAGSQVGESLEEVGKTQLLALKALEKKGERLDVKAAQHEKEAAAAGLEAQQEKDKPTLDLFASAALNGRSNAMTDAISDSFKAGRETYALGVKFVLPLDFGSLSDYQHGLEQEKNAAGLNLEARQFAEKRDWEGLNQRFAEARRRLEIAYKIVDTQKAKVENENRKFKQGRSTTFQILQFEQDLADSEIGLIQAEWALLATATQMKLFIESIPGG